MVIYSEDPLETGEDWIDQTYGGEDSGDFDLLGYSYADYARDTGYDNPGTEDAYDRLVKKHGRKKKDIGAVNEKHLEYLAEKQRNAFHKAQRERFELIKQTRTLVYKDRDLLTRAEYLQLDDMVIYRTKRHGIVEMTIKGLKQQKPSHRSFRRPHPKIASEYTTTGIKPKKYTKDSIVTMEIDVSFVTKDKAGRWTYFDSLPRPTKPLFYNPNTDTITYTWACTQAERNRLVHALNGNVNVHLPPARLPSVLETCEDLQDPEPLLAPDGWFLPMEDSDDDPVDLYLNDPFDPFIYHWAASSSPWEVSYEPPPLDLLACGDVEANPGPPKAQGGAGPAPPAQGGAGPAPPEKPEEAGGRGKKCSKCGSDKHLARACKNNAPKGGAKGGGRNGDQKLKEADKDFDARKKADEDVRREKMRDEAAKPKDHEKDLPQFPINRQFVINDTKPVNLSLWVYILVLWKFMGPIIVFILAADLLIWPLLCLYLGYLVQHFYGMMAGSVIAGLSFWAENVFMVILVYYGNQALKFFRWTTRTDRRIEITPLDGPVRLRELDHRPSDMKHGPREFAENLVQVEEYELFFIEWHHLQITLHYGESKLRSYVASGSAFAMLGSAITSRKTRLETADGVRRILTKFSKVDWDANAIINLNIIENTAILLDHWKHFIDDTVERHSMIQDRFSYEYLDDFDEWCPAYFRGLKNKCITLFVGSVIIMFILQWVFWIGSILSVGAMAASQTHGFVLAAYDDINRVSPTATTSSPLEPGSPTGVYGYRVTDSYARDLENNMIAIDKQISIELFPVVAADRVLMNVFTPCAIPGLAMPVCDRNDVLTTAAGLTHRGGGQTPRPLPSWLADKKNISDEVCAAYFPVLNDSDVLPFSEVLEKLPYTVPRKQILKNQHANRAGNYSRYARNRETGFFGKDEPYETVKHLRGIHAMGDNLWDSDVLCAMGAWVKTVETFVYTIPPCAKHLDPRGVVDKLMNLGPGSKTVSDYSSYEASFTRPVKESAQFALYDYMSKGLGHGQQLRGYYRWLLGGVNRVRNKYFNAQISNIKCSGDFDTALSNWWDNVIAWLTVFSTKHGVHWSDAIDWFLCEGDDNITDDHGFEMSPSDFANLGLKAKIQSGLSAEEAGFCQKFVNPDSGNLVGDVIRFLGKRQYFSTQYQDSNAQTKMSLLRAVAMSTLSTMPNAPGISEWAWKMMQMTQGCLVKSKHLNKMKAYGTVISQNFTEPKISFSDRLMVSSVFGFTLEQQGVLTAAINEWVYGPLVLPLSWFPDTWVDFYATYSGCPGQVLDESEPDAVERVKAWLAPVLEKSSAGYTSL